MTIGDHLGKSTVRYSLCPGYSRSTIVVDGRSPGGVYEPGDACVAPTQIYRTHRGWTLSIGTRFVPLRGVIVIIGAICGSVEKGTVWFKPFFMGTVRYSRQQGEGDSHHLGGDHLGAVSGAFPVNNRGRWSLTRRSLPTGRRMRRPYTDLSNPPCLDAFHWYPFRSSAGRRHNLRHLRFGIPGVRGIRGQQSRSMVAHPEVFTNRATHASPLPRFIEPTAPGRFPLVPVSFLRMGDSGEGDSLV